MTTARHLAIAALCALASAAGSAQAQSLTRAGLVARGTADGFEVFARVGAWGDDYFCAAGDFAARHLNARAVDRVAILSPLGPSRTVPGRRSVIFHVGPDIAPGQQEIGSVILRPTRPGQPRTVAAARGLCESLQRADDD